MGLTFVGVATGAGGDGATTATVGEVSSTLAGDIGYIYIATKPAESGDQPLPVSNVETLETTTWEAIGWSQIVDEVVGGGSHGSTTGPVRLQVYKKTSTSNDEFQNPSLSYLIPVLRSGSNGGLVTRIQVWRPGSGEVISESFTTGSDTTSDTTWSVTGSSSPGFSSGDKVVLWNGITNPSTQVGGTSSLAATGATFASLSDATTQQQNGGSVKGSLANADVSAGSSTANPTYTAQSNGSMGGTLFLRLRATPEPEEITLGTVIGQGSLFNLTGRMEGSFSDRIDSEGTVNALTGVLSGTLGLIEETGTLYPIGLLYTLDHIEGEGTLNDLTQTLHGGLGLVTETGTTNAITGQLSGTLGHVTGSATFRSLIGRMTSTLGNISGPGTVNALSGAVGRVLGLITETGTVYTPGKAAAGTLGLVDGVDTVNALTYGELYQLGLITGSSTANALTGELSGTLGLVSGAATLNDLTGRTTGPLGLITESGALEDLAGAAAGTLGLVTETSELYSINGSQPVFVLGLIEETGELHALNGAQSGSLALITESGLLLPLTLEFSYRLEQPVLKVIVNPRALRVKLP